MNEQPPTPTTSTAPPPSPPSAAALRLRESVLNCGVIGVSLIEDERLRQIRQLNFHGFNDDGYTFNQLACAAEAYLSFYTAFAPNLDEGLKLSRPPASWPWPEASWKPSADPIRNLVKAGALIAAEIDRLKRLEAAKNPQLPLV